MSGVESDDSCNSQSGVLKKKRGRPSKEEIKERRKREKEDLIERINRQKEIDLRRGSRRNMSTREGNLSGKG